MRSPARRACIALATTAMWLPVCPAADAQTAPVRSEAPPEHDNNVRTQPVADARQAHEH